MIKIKVIIFFLITLFSHSTFGQIEGEFYHNLGFGIECIKFLKNNKFEYSHQHNHCKGIDRGKGIYELSRTKLILRFQTDTTNFNKNFIRISKSPTLKDSITVNILVLNETTIEPLPFTAAFFATLNNKEKYAITDIEGKTRVKLVKSSDTLVVGLFYAGYGHISQKIVPDSDYRLVVILSPRLGKQYETGDQMEFKIKVRSNNSIKLKHSYPEPQFIKIH